MKASTPTETIRPPLTTDLTRPWTMEPSWQLASMLSHLRICWARSKETVLEVDLELHADLDFGHVGEFGLGDEALGLAVDVDDDELVVADLGDGRRDDGVGLERAEIGLGEQFFHDAHCVFDCGSWASRRTFPGFWLLVGFLPGDSAGRRRRAGERSKTNDPRGAGKPRLLPGGFFRAWPGRGGPGRPLFQLSA